MREGKYLPLFFFLPKCNTHSFYHKRNDKFRFIGQLVSSQIVYNAVTTTRSGREGSRGGRLCAERCSNETKNGTIGTIGQRLPVSPSLVPFLARQERYAPRSGENRFDVSSHNSLDKNTSSAPSGHLPLKGKALVRCVFQTHRQIGICSFMSF